MLGDNDVLNYKSSLLRAADSSISPTEVMKESPTNNNNNINGEHAIQPPINIIQDPLPSPKQNTPETLLLPEMVNSEKIKVRLTGKKFAYLEYPENLNKTDVAILQKQIEQLALIAE